MNPIVHGVAHQVRLGLALNLRNRTALIYGFLFPLVFLFSFWAIYRHDRVPLALHMGELLTVTVLGGACFGLPTTFVSERERGVWRRYRLTPMPAWAFVASTLATRYVLLITAALMQVAVALAIGMPAPSHPLDLFVAFTVTCLAFLGLGMVIAMLADTVPAVQALGQCIFLPMLMIGGVAVRLSSLPDWALHASAFFPGRYAVEAMQHGVTGDGLRDAGFALAALLLIGAAAGIAAAQMFRWDASRRPATKANRAWLVLAFGMWLVVGLLAERQNRVAIAAPPAEEPEKIFDFLKSVPAARTTRRAPDPPSPPPPVAPSKISAPSPNAAPAPAPVTPNKELDAKPARSPRTWQDAGPTQFEEIAFDRLPSDGGLVSPIAAADQEPDAMVAAQLGGTREALAQWPPAKAADPVQRARNLLFVAAIPDVLQMEQVERYLPLLIFERLRTEFPAEDLPKILYWIAMHPAEGDDSAVGELESLGLPAVSGPTRTARSRVMLYALKLLGRLTGEIKP